MEDSFKINEYVLREKMKLLLVFTAVILNVSGLSVHQQWASFKEKHGKFYKNIIEEKRRFDIFQSNLNIIKEHNLKYEKGQSTYYMGVNKFTDLTADEFTGKFPRKPRNKLDNKEPFTKTPKDFEYPESMDWREKGAVLPVRDQGDCRAGYAFATAGSIEAQLAILHNQSITVSVQEIIDCSAKYFNSGCLGGISTGGFMYVAVNGISSDSSYPYVGKTQHCKNISEKISINIGGSQRVAMSEDALIWIIATIGPANVEIYANPLIQHYEGGIYDDYDRCLNDADLVNHGVLVIGYGSENGVDYWILKNSWGDKWGEEGFFKLRRNPSICGILTDIRYVQTYGK